MSQRQALDIIDLQQRVVALEAAVKHLCEIAGLLDPEPGPYSLLEKTRGWYGILMNGKECPEFPSMRRDQAIEMLAEMNRSCSAKASQDKKAAA